MNWTRFADNIYICCSDYNEAVTAFNVISGILENDYELSVNTQKSGVSRLLDKRILGYDICKENERYVFKRHQYQNKSVYHNWHENSIERIDSEYHLTKEGILTQQDYSLLYEAENNKFHIPVEVVDAINIYSNVTLAYNARKTLSDHNIQIHFFDKYGNLQGSYLPWKSSASAFMSLHQYELYTDDKKRIPMARSMELASIHNMRANLRYYKKQGINTEDTIKLLSKSMSDANQAKTVNDLMLVEARARQAYYGAFKLIIPDPAFEFTQRTRRPPQDPINTLISFGNTLLYTFFEQSLHRAGLDVRIGIVHAANHRLTSLNLDFADLFKPVVTDRIICSLVNHHALNPLEHFQNEDGGIYLNSLGKKIFLKEYYKKLDTKITIDNKQVTYRQLMVSEVYAYRSFVEGKSNNYKPYKYY